MKTAQKILRDIGKLLAIACFITCSIVGCKVTDQLGHQNLQGLYSEEIENMNLCTRLYYHTGDSFTVYVSFDPKVVFQHIDKMINKYELKLHCSFYENFDSDKLIDSFRVKRNVSPEEVNSEKLWLSLKTQQVPKAGLLDLHISDSRFAIEYRTFINLEDPATDCSQNYLPVLSENNQVISSDYLQLNREFSLTHSTDTFRRIYVTHYTGNFSPALPTFANDENLSFNFRVDTVFTISTDEKLQFRLPGVYAFSIDTFKRVGLSLIAVEGRYPEISNSSEMLESLRYITSNFEFEGLKQSPDTKKATDEFWSLRSGSFERGHSLIRSYYSRIERANKLFISFMEGWKTDRGMVSIVHGEPDWIYKTLKSEEWIYFDRKGNQTLSFYFLKLNNPLSDHHYYLLRGPSFQDSWNRAVFEWRSGKIPQ